MYEKAPMRTPGELFSLLYNKIPPLQRLAFMSTFITGFLCHLFIFTNSMYNNDDIRYLYVTFDKPELGRWLQVYAAGISSYFSLPVVNSILALFYASVAVMFITALLKLSSRLHVVLAGALFVTFPTMASLYSFVFAADPFMLSALCACGAAYFVTIVSQKIPRAWIAGALLLCISVGIYQAYLPFTLLLMLLYYLMLLAEPGVSARQLIDTGLRYVYMLVAGMAAYYIGMKATLYFKHIELSDYQGVSDSSLPAPAQLLQRMYRALVDFREFFSGDQVLCLNGWLKAGLVICILVTAVSYIYLAATSGMHKSPLRLGLAVFSIICVPFSVNVIWLISDTVNFHLLMRHGWCLLYVGMLAIAGRAAERLGGGTLRGDVSQSAAAGEPAPLPYVRPLVLWGAFICSVLVIWNYVLIDNIGYFNMNFRYEKTYALCLKIAAHMEASEDYDRHRPIAFVGDYSRTYTMDAATHILGPMAGMKGDRVFGGSSRAYLPFFQNCLGEDIEVVDPATEEALKSDERFMAMARFPDEGSIAVIDGITVVKLND